MRLDINSKRKTVRNTNIWRLNMFINNQQITEEIKRKIKKILETNDNENTTTQNLWDAVKNSAKREVHSNMNLPQKSRKKERRIKSTKLERKMRSISSNASLNTCVSLLIFCFDDLSFGVSGVLKSPTIIVYCQFLF